MTRILLVLLIGWTAVGAVGVAISFKRNEREKGLKNLGWIAAVWSVYLAVLLGTSLFQGQRTVPAGKAQCFDEMCFTVTGTEEVPGYLMQQGRLLRVHVSIQNRGKKPQGESLLHAYLVDQQGRRWLEVPGLTGVRLTTRVSGGETVISEPVFKLPPDAIPAGLVLTHGRLQPGVLVIGDPDSLLHRPTLARITP